MNLSLQQLTFERNFRTLFQGITMEITRGECLHIVGCNGSGKSTLLRILTGLTEPSAGKVYWNHEPLTPEYRNHLHFIGHQNGIKPELTAFENLHFYSVLCDGDFQPTKIPLFFPQNLLAVPAHQLSAGQLRRLALSRLLVKKLSLWILDEPTTALDSSGKKLFYDVLNQHLATGGLAIVTSHEETTALPHCKKLHLGECYV